MKNLFQMFRKNSITVHAIAAAMIVCMLLADASLYLSYASGMKDASEDLQLVTEEHELETALADGEYKGNNSNSEIGESGEGTISTPKQIFVVLEILPTAKKGVIGYTIGGCEPFDINATGLKGVSDADMREAYMDALINKNPGADNANEGWLMDKNSERNYLAGYILDLNSKMKEGNGRAPFIFEYNGSKTGATGIYNGYYKFVGNNRGVYAIDNKESTTPDVKSRFYYPGRNDYNYIFVYDKAPDNAQDIKVENHKRIRYFNNEKFLKDYLGIPESGIATWKETHDIKVITKAPQDVNENDIEIADAIIMNNGNNMDYHTVALNLYNKLHNKNENTDANLVFSKNIDFQSFEYVIRIYERIVIRKDAAMIASKNCYLGKLIDGSDFNGEKFDTNMRKLMCMLFFVYKKTDEKDQYGNELKLPGSGRDMFQDFMKRYTSNPGNYPAGVGAKEGETYWDLRQANPDYIAPGLRKSAENYMHYYKFDPGHPLVRDYKDAITGGHYEGGVLVAEHNYDIAKNQRYRRIQRSSEQYFINCKIPKQDNSHPDGYYYIWWDSEHPWGLDSYMSMSNTTDYTYIDDYGTLHRDSKYSGDNGYWYQIDMDDGLNWHAYKKICWNEEEWPVWPWGETMEEWLIAKERTIQGRNGSEKGNVHLWYDYYEYGGYRGLKAIDGSAKFENQSIEQENDMLKGDLITNALTKRKIARERDDPNHTSDDKKTREYYISMNILNGDGVNKSPTATEKNKVLYFNEYEKDKILAKKTDASETYIPIKIRIRSSVKINSISVLNSTNTVVATYPINSEVGKTTITKNGSGSVNTRTLILEPKNELDANGIPTFVIGEEKIPVYTYEGFIQAELSDLYSGKRNTKFIVKLTAEKPGGNESDASDDAAVTDEVTFVRRDFFMLD